MTEGKVKFFHDTAGYGFISSPDVEGDVFIHHTNIVMSGHRTLHKDEPVEFEYVKGDKGWKATSCTPIYGGRAE